MPDWTTYKGQTPWENPVMRKKTSYNEGALIADSRNPVWQYPEWRTTPVTDKHLPCGYWDAKQNARDARVVFNITHPVGYDTWKVDGVEYQGKISYVAGGRHSSYYSNLEWAIYLNNLASVTKALYLLGTGEHNFNNIHPYHLSHFRGVNNATDAIITAIGGSSTILLSQNGKNIIENAYVDASAGGQAFAVWITSDGIVNKCCVRSATGAGSLINVNASAHSAVFSYCTFEKLSAFSALYVAKSITSLIKCFQDGTWVDSYGTGSYVVYDVEDEATAGYGYDYGDYIITDWEFDGIKKKLSYEGGTAVDVSAGGYFTLTNTKREFINIHVEAASLPSVDKTLTIYNDRYTDGIKII
jgi:hypothetical protein